MRKLTVEELNRKSVSEFIQSPKTPIIIILDNVRSLNNVGSVFRTADAFLVEAVYLCGITGKPPHKDIEKTALGATETVAWKYFDKTIDAVKALKEQGYLVYSIEQADSAIMLNNFMPARKQKIAIIFGNEVKGVEQEVINESTDVIEIPQIGTKHSFNVSVCVGIVMWDLYLKIK